MGNPTMWFEVAAKDREAMKGFYSGLFDWKLNDMEAMPYTDRDRRRRGSPVGSAQAPAGNDGPRHLLRRSRRRRRPAWPRPTRSVAAG